MSRRDPAAPTEHEGYCTRCGTIARRDELEDGAGWCAWCVEQFREELREACRAKRPYREGDEE